MPHLGDSPRACFKDSLPCILAYRFEQVVASPPITFCHHYQRLVHKPADQLEYLGTLNIVCSAYRLGRLEGPAVATLVDSSYTEAAVARLGAYR